MRERAAMGRECGWTSVMSAAAPSMAHGPLRVEERWLSRRARVEGEEAGEAWGDAHPAVLSEPLVQLVAPRIAVALHDRHDGAPRKLCKEAADLAVGAQRQVCV